MSPEAIEVDPVTLAADRQVFRDMFDVSRETLARLDVYVEVLLHWQKSMNLIGPDTQVEVWTRHVLDSAQLAVHVPDEVWARGRGHVDLGSGAGFPGLVLAILSGAPTHLIERDQRKAAFLREAARLTAAPVTVHAVGAGTLDLPPADVMTARALAPLERLLPLAARFADKDTICLFPKGRDVRNELTRARKAWTIDPDLIPSITDPEARIVRLKGPSRARNERSRT